MSCCQESPDSPLQPSTEIELWMDMMKHMLECAEFTMSAIKQARQKLKFSNDDLMRFGELCNAVDKLRQQLVSVGENFVKSPDSIRTNRPIDVPKPPKLIRRKTCCVQSEDDPLKPHKRKTSLRKNACFCGKFKKKLVDKSRDRKIIVCSPAKIPKFVNQKCSRSFVIPKDVIDSGGEPGRIPQGDILQPSFHGNDSSDGSNIEELNSTRSSNVGKTSISGGPGRHTGYLAILFDSASETSNPFVIRDNEKCSLPVRGIGYEFFCAMNRYSDRIAQHIDDTGEQQTFAELLKDCVSVAHKLQQNNSAKGDVICICLSNHKYTCVPFIAAAFAGCQINALDVNFNLPQLDYLLEMVKPKMMFVQKEILPLIEASLQKNSIDDVQIVVIGGDVEGYVPFQEYLEVSDEDISNFRPQKVDTMNETFAILYTSGTTGDPKGVRLSHHSMLKQFVVALASGNFQRVFLSYSSYYSVMTLIFLGASILGGFSRVIASHFNPEGIYGIINKYKVESAFIRPDDCVTLTRLPKPENVDTSSLKVLATGGACLKATYQQELRSLFPETWVFQVYVITECGGLTLLWSKNQMNHVKLSNAKSGSSGMPCGGTCCKIVDIKSGEILGPNQTGELCVKSDTIMERYHVQNSSDRISSSEWFKTGDLAYYDEYHCFYIIDRVTELINVGEKSIYPCKLESILMEHPVVDRAVVLGLPDSNSEVVPVGFILPKSTAEPEIDLNELLEFVNKQIGEDENLKGGVRIVNNIPLTVTGKVRRKDFRESMVSEEKTEVEEPPTD